MYDTSDDYKTKIYNTIHSLKVYINDIEIDSKYILDCKPSKPLFTNNEFELGSVISQAVELKLYKTVVPDIINKVEIKSGISGEIIPIGVFNIEDISKDDDYTVSLKLLDNMIKFEFNYDGSKLTYPVTLLTVLQDICSKAEVELGSTSFLNMNKEVAVYDNTVSARTYLSYIAESAGGFACIGRDGKLYIKTIGGNTTELPLKYFQNFKWGEKFKVSRVRYEDGVQLFEKGNTTDNTVYINPDNMYIVDQEQIDNIYDALEQLEVYSFEGDSIIDPAIDVGDILLIGNKKVIYQGTMQFMGRWKANVSSKIQSKNKEETTVRKPSQKTINRRVQSQMDQTEGKITQLIEETTEQSQKITEVEQTIEGISQKVENIQDFTKEKTQNENLYIEDIAEGEGYILKFIVYGNTELFKTKDITICASQNGRGYGEAIYLLTEDGEELLTEDSQQFIIGEGAYYLNSLKITLDDYLRSLTKDGKEYYDTLEIEQDGTIKVIRRIGINEQGGLYVLAKETETVLKDKILLPSQKDTGTYYFVKEVQGLNYYAQYIIENDYSKTFLTKLELGTKIEQNTEAVKVAWNQISDFIQMMIIDNNASFAVLDKDKKVMMSLDKTGQHFYKDGTAVFGEMGVQTVDNNKFIAFSVEGEYESNISNGMAWGIKTKSDNKFYPIFYIKNFSMGPKNSDGGYGELVLSSCDISLDGIETGIVSGNIKMFGDPGGDTLYFVETSEGKILFKITKGDNTTHYDTINILDKIEFYKNSGGGNSFKIGDNTNYCLLTDDGYIYSKHVLADDIPNSNDIYNISGVANSYFYANFRSGGSVYLYASSSDKNLKENIKNTDVNAIKLIKQIKHRKFNWKKTKEHQEIGYIAQEMQKIDKNFVHYNKFKTPEGEEKEDWQINTLAVLATATKAIQEQQEEIENLKAIINKQQEQINQILGGE